MIDYLDNSTDVIEAERPLKTVSLVDLPSPVAGNNRTHSTHTPHTQPCTARSITGWKENRGRSKERSVPGIISVAGGDRC